MKKGLLGAYQLGYISGASEAIKIAEQVTGRRGCELEGLFFATAFQAGVDEFLLPHLRNDPASHSDFLRSRVRYLDQQRSSGHSNAVRGLFSKYLPEGWERDDRYLRVWRWHSFLTDMLDTMAESASLLAASGVPDADDIEDLLPSEVVVPLANLLDNFESVNASSLVPQRVVSRDTIERFTTVIFSDLFSRYSMAQAVLNDAGVPLASALGGLHDPSRQLTRAYPGFLALRKAGASILSITPKVVDAALGKLPGVLAEVAAKRGLTLLESRQRLVIYDFRASFQQALLGNLVRMLNALDKARDG